MTVLWKLYVSSKSDYFSVYVMHIIYAIDVMIYLGRPALAGEGNEASPRGLKNMNIVEVTMGRIWS